MSVSSVTDSVTEEEINNKALQAQFYNHVTHDWIGLNPLERLVRSILSKLGIMVSVEKTCIKYSWQSISEMKEIPPSIQTSIAKYFTDSRSPTHPLNVAAPSITAIYCKTFPPEKTYIIQEDENLRLFHILDHQQQLLATVVSSAYGKLDFYDKNKKLTFVNRHDVLTQEPPATHSWKVKMEPTSNSLWSKICNPSKRIQLWADADEPLMTVAAEGDPHTFVFRHPTTQKIIAIAVWNRRRWEIDPVQKWTLSMMPDTTVDSHLLTWPLLKHSQEYMKEPQKRPYVLTFNKP